MTPYVYPIPLGASGKGGGGKGTHGGKSPGGKHRPPAPVKSPGWGSVPPERVR